MAKCPKCHGELGQTEPICPSCGYDFPESEIVGNNSKTGFINGWPGNTILIFGYVEAGLVAAILVIIAIFDLLQLDWWGATWKLLLALNQLVFFITLIRLVNQK